MFREFFPVRMVVLWFLLSGFACIYGAESARRSAFEFEIHTGYYTKYSGEGIISNPDANLQSELAIGYAGFRAGVLGVFDLTDVLGYRDDIEEWNYMLGYSHTLTDLPLLGAVTLELGWTYYDIPRASEDDYQELNFSVTLDDVPLTPGFAVNWDYENDTVWFTGSCGYSLSLAALSEKLSWDSELALHWGNARWTDSLIGVKKDALATAVFSTGPSWAFNEYVQGRIFVQLAWGLNGQVREAMREDPWNHSCNVSGGIALDIAW